MLTKNNTAKTASHASNQKQTAPCQEGDQGTHSGRKPHTVVWREAGERSREGGGEAEIVMVA